MKENTMSKTSENSKDEFVLEVTQEEYNEALKKGWTDDDIHKPGKHRYRRVSPERVYQPNEVKVKITLEVDGDVLMYFRQLAESEDAESYQVKMNEILRAEMESKSENAKTKVVELTKNKEFIQAVAEQVKELIAA